jgi:hypothetical protein
LFLLSFNLCKVFVFCFICSDDENPKRDAATAPFVEATAADAPSHQEAAPVLKSPEAPAKTVSSSRGSKRLKKVKDASASLNAPQPTSSSDDISADPCALRCFIV